MVPRNCPTYVYNLLQPYVRFQATRKIDVVDYPLGLLYYGLIISAVVYVFITIVNENSHVHHEKPIGLVTPYFHFDSENANYYASQEDFYEQLSKAGGLSPSYRPYRFCNNPEYDYKSSEEFKFFNVSCKALLDSEAHRKVSLNELFIPTFQDQRVTTFINSATDNCDNVTGGGPEVVQFHRCCANNGIILYRLGKCFCTATSGQYTYGFENLTLIVEHRYESSDQKGVQPKTKITNHNTDEVYMTFPEGSLVQLPIFSLLALTNVDLDSRQTEDKFKGEDSNGQEVMPFVRTTGILLMVHLNYNSKSSKVPSSACFQPTSSL